jgi:DNA modification methylase
MTKPEPLLTEQPVTVEEYQFKPNPIKGYPELYWRGKRPFTSTRFYPAQLKETHGKAVEGPDGREWLNKIFWGDNLQVMSHLLKDYRGKVDLIYIDPPFDSKADYKKKIEIRGLQTSNNGSVFEEKQYTDIWNNDEYLQYMYERIILCKELLSERGTIYVHCDWHVNHYLKLILDQVFGFEGLRNEIIWCYTGPNPSRRDFPKKHDTIYRYVKSDDYIFNPDDIRIAYKATFTTERGIHGVKNIDEEQLRERHNLGKVPESWWSDISNVSSWRNELLGYPTQKPEALVERIVKSSSELGSIVFDCFMGSGTAQAVAMKLGRRFIGADINLGAVQTTTKRLLKIAVNLQKQQPTLGDDTPIYYTGFEIYNVNNYDVFRNPLEAKDLLADALEIQRFPAGNLFDGEKDGRLVKIMPVNRIATRADLNELLTGFDYAEFEKRKAQNPSRPVEKFLLVCMGHEPDLKAQLQKEVGQYLLDIEVVDILRDRQDLQFKRDSEAVIAVENGELVISQFYPMNLLNKLSMQQENVTDWRELVESVMIDWNYDGAVISQPLTDIPDKNGLVKGRYKVPDGTSNIRVKITDLLSESLEMDVPRG